jgi:hypothetical protein
MISYLDAGTGSMIVTALAGGFVGAVVAVKMAMARIKTKITRKSPSDKVEGEDNSDSVSN